MHHADTMPAKAPRRAKGAAATAARRATTARTIAYVQCAVGSLAAAALPAVALAEGYSVTWACMGAALAFAVLAVATRRAGA